MGLSHDLWMICSIHVQSRDTLSDCFALSLTKHFFGRWLVFLAEGVKRSLFPLGGAAFLYLPICHVGYLAVASVTAIYLNKHAGCTSGEPQSKSPHSTVSTRENDLRSLWASYLPAFLVHCLVVITEKTEKQRKHPSVTLNPGREYQKVSNLSNMYCYRTSFWPQHSIVRPDL